MPIRVLNSNEVKTMLELAKSPLRPKSIVAARIAYDEDFKAVMEKVTSDGRIDPADGERLVATRHSIDAMYGRWIAGEFANEEMVEDPFL